MSDSKPIFRCSSITAIVDGKEVELGTFLINHDASDAEPDRSEWRKFQEDVAAGRYSVTHMATLTSADYALLYGVIVGADMKYELRELHRNLGRYARWPYTN